MHADRLHFVPICLSPSSIQFADHANTDGGLKTAKLDNITKTDLIQVTTISIYFIILSFWNISVKITLL